MFHLHAIIFLRHKPNNFADRCAFYTLCSCACGDVYQTNNIPENGHIYGEWNIVAEATTEAEGEKEKACAACGNTYYSDKTPVRSHLYGDWEAITQATVDSPGSKTCSCIKCGHILTATIPKLKPDTVEKYENYVDSRVEIEIRPDGARRFYYNPVYVVDIRTWGDPATIRITDEGGFYVTYFKQNRSKVELNISPIAGYVRRMVIMEDGSYMLSLFGDFKD